MIVRCVSTALTQKQLSLIGQGFSESQAERLLVDEHYLVLGLQLEVQSLIWGSGPWVQLAFPDEIYVAPLCLFEVVDGRASRHWEVRHWEDGSVTLQPRSFYADFYRNDLKSKTPRVVQDFRAVCKRLELEAAQPAEEPSDGIERRRE